MSVLKMSQLEQKRRNSDTDIKAETQGVSLCEWGINGTSGLPSREGTLFG
uniref:Uncharacterized protein n=1 Tax=Fundulus heteroclitus TaxID=8078 RepID=A0A146PVS8_FUNHE